MISTPMLVSALSGLALLMATVAMVFLVTNRKPAKRHVSFHRAFAWTVLAAAAAHGAWGLVAVFILKS
jgi:zinc transporter ZupT